MMEPLKEFGIVPLNLDVTNYISMQECVKTVLDAENRIDVLVNNAGYGYFGTIENVTMDEARKQHRKRRKNDYFPAQRAPDKMVGQD